MPLHYINDIKHVPHSNLYNPWTHRTLLRNEDQATKTLSSPNLQDLVAKLIDEDGSGEDFGRRNNNNLPDRFAAWNLDDSFFNHPAQNFDNTSSSSSSTSKINSSLLSGGDGLNNNNVHDQNQAQAGKAHAFNVPAKSFFPAASMNKHVAPHQLSTSQPSIGVQSAHLQLNNQKNLPPLASSADSSDSCPLSLLASAPLIRSIRARSNINDISPISKFHLQVERCCEQLRLLERERKKVEADLTELFPNDKISSANNIPVQRQPPNPSRVDRLITEMLKMHAKLVTLMAIMERLRDNKEFSRYIHESISKWLDSINNLRMRKEELLTSRTMNGNVSNDDLNESAMDQITEVIGAISNEIRMVRTCLWCSLVATTDKRFN